MVVGSSHFSAYWIQISLRSSTILYFSADRLNCAKIPSLKCAHISLWLNHTGRSKFHNISNHPPIPLGLLVLSCTHQCRQSPITSSPPPPFFLLSRTEEPSKGGTCARDRHALQQLALNVHVKLSDLTCAHSEQAVIADGCHGLCVYDSRLVISSNPVRGWWEKRGCSGLTLTHWAFKSPVWVGAGTEMRTHYLPAH